MSSESSDISFARIVTIEGRQIILSRQEYGIIQSALEWWRTDLDEEASASDEEHFEELRMEAQLADRIWRQL